MGQIEVASAQTVIQPWDRQWTFTLGRRAFEELGVQARKHAIPDPLQRQPLPRQPLRRLRGGLIASAGVRWYFDALGSVKDSPMTCLEWAPKNDDIRETAYPRVTTRVHEAEYTEITAMVGEDEDLILGVLRDATLRFIGALKTEQPCALDVVKHVQTKRPASDVLMFSDVHIACV